VFNNLKRPTKRILFQLLSIILCMGLLTACAGPAQSGGDIPSESEQNTNQSPSDIVSPEKATYYILGGNFVGSWADGAWRSLNDPSGNFEDRYSNDFYFKDILSAPRYSLYSRNGKIGSSDFALVNGGAGVSGFEDGDKTALFAPYAKPDPGGLWPYNMEIALPAEFGPEMDALKLPTFGYSLRLSYENIDLATNSESDLNPFGKVDWSLYWSEQEGYDALKSLLAENGITCEPHVNYTASADFNRDGKRDMLLFAGTERDENGYLKVSPEDGGIYSVILLCLADGSYETVYQRIEDYTAEVTTHYSLHPLGVFDLNSDGIFEICAVMGEWEWGYTFVLSRDESGSWQPVLRANWGT